MNPNKLDEKRVSEAHQKIADSGLAPVTKKKPWIIFRAIVHGLYIEANQNSGGNPIIRRHVDSCPR